MKKPILAIFLFLSHLAFSQTNPQYELATVNNKNHIYDSFFRNAYLQNPKIPKGVLEAVAYTTTRIHHITPSAIQSCVELPPVYGVMGLTLDGKNYFRDNLLLVSQLSGFTPEEIMNDPEKNILAFAKAYSELLLSDNINTDKIEAHLPVLIALSELPNYDLQTNFALNSHLFSVLSFLNSSDNQSKFGFPNHSVDLIGVFGEENYNVLSSPNIIISEDGIKNKDGIQYKNGGNNPSVQSADYAPALWNAAASCNYSSRSGTAISAVVIHDVEGSYAGCISWFKNCSSSVSAHYVIRSSDGQITQMVLESNKAWHVGTHNPYTIGIEHEGYQAQTGWYTNAMYTASANLVKDICNSGYGINPSTCYNGPSCNGICTLSTSYKIKGHQHYSSQTHNDPGPNWNWYTYYNLINGTTSCGTPSSLSATAITSVGATLNWAAITGASSYNIQYRKTGTTSWTASTSTTNSKSITGLLSSSTYEFQVQAICSGTSGSFSSSSTFTTLSAIANDNCSGAQTLTSGTTCVSTSGNIAGATASGMAKASCDVFSGTPLLKDVWFNFTATNPSHTIKVTPSSGFDAVVALYTSCTGGQVGCSDNGGGGGGIETITSSGLTSGTTYYVRIYSYGSTAPSTTTFNICITNPAPPSCGTPSSLSSSSVTVNSATLSWLAVSGASSYNLHYRKTGTTTWINTTSTTTSKSITGLTASTTYEFQVQAICSGTSGSFSSSATFTTLTAPTTTTISIGSGTSAYSAHPYGTVYMDERVEYIVTKTELTAAGWTSTTPKINSLAFNVSSASAQAMNSFTITLSHTSSSIFGSTTFLSGTNSVTVYSGTTTAIAGWNTYNFSTPFTYNGTSNLLITICWNNTSFTSNSSVLATSYSNYVALYYRADVSGGGVCSQSTGTKSYYRPNMKMLFSSNPPSKQEEATGENEELSKSTESQFEIFPNPSDGTIIFGKIPGAENKIITIIIYDLSGKEVFTEKISVAHENFNISFTEAHLKHGLYLLSATIENNQMVKRIVIR